MDNQIGIIRQNPVILVFKVALLSVLFNISYLIVTLASEYIDTFAEASINNVVGYDTVFMIVLIVLQSVIGVWLVLSWLRDVYVVDQGMLVHKTGILFAREDRFHMTGLENISYTQSFWGRMLQYGDVSMMYPVQGKIVLRAVSYPERFVKTFEQISSHFREVSKPEPLTDAGQ
jgi:hypothetical protein